MASKAEEKDRWRHWQVRQNVKGKALAIYRAARQQREQAGDTQSEAHGQALAEVYARARSVSWGHEPSLPKGQIIEGDAGETPVLNAERIHAIYAKRRAVVRQRVEKAYTEVSMAAAARGESRQAAHEEGVAEVYAQGKAVASHRALTNRDIAEREAAQDALGEG